MWDIFISHASEDKETFVRPLAKELMDYGVDIWYDEFSLKMGDSLTASIDKGLQESEYGLIVISPAFLTKNWTDYELKSLLIKELNGGKVILPIWHNINQKMVSSKSLYLADKKALSSDMEIDKLAFEIIKIVRPDIINSHLLVKAGRELRKTAKEENVELNNIYNGPIVHQSLPTELVVSSKLLQTLFPFNSFKDFVTDFARDFDYQTEFGVWIAIACAYIDTTKTFNIPLSDKEICDKIQAFLISLSLHDWVSIEKISLDKKIKNFAIEAYSEHIKFVKTLINGEVQNNEG